MQRSITQKIIRHSGLLSIILHLLLCLGIITLVTTQPVEQQAKKAPHLFVPSYIYKGAIKPSVQHAAKQQPQPSMKPTEDQEQNRTAQEAAKPEQNNIGIEKQTQAPSILPEEIKKPKSIAKKKIPLQKSMLAASFAALKQDQLNDVTKTRTEDPIYLIGDSNQPADPLIKLMGRSLSAHFAYPRMAGRFGIRGRALIGLTLHPEGYYSDVELLRSTGNQELDGAALYAVNSAPKVIGADHYISQPKHFVIGFIFE